ncbi:lycopene cyclase [Chryseobacterium sp. Leaf180]|uniref:lycopene cyclase domain-containing protein n=1 Tax=Chryseobacterium sp. Leaf180 TaxID=1736289 RepID=UPI0006F3794E|nr:lycopene cyclase domain-containing protein [Chryseobacterium sp. Leaf180]KQR94776.1 lycopene cyclase [Chryseobacterium sp. Leaf180]
MWQYTYLLINFFTVIVCFLFSFHPKIKFNKHFKAFFMASALVAVFFIAWDAWFTEIGVWWFNDKYLLGLRFFGLPIEEILFFICIPFSCVFTYFCIDKFFDLNWKPTPERILVIVMMIFFLIVGLIYHDRIYTFVTMLTTVATLFVMHFILKVRWIGKATVIYLILSPGFLGVNGILTGTGLESPIVNYNLSNFIGIRMWTIPVEDAVYGLELILWNLFFFKKFKKLDEQN